MSSRGECGRDGWVLTSGVAPFSWRFSDRLVSALASSGIPRSSLWDKSTYGRIMASISPSKTSFIISSFLMCPVRSGVLAKLVGEFSADSTYSGSLSHHQKLAANVTSMSGLAGGLGGPILTSIGCA